MTDTPADTSLWCVNITGPDDIFAVASRTEAITLAARFNAWWMDSIASKGPHPDDPTMWAVPQRWPYSATSHASSLANPGEYSWLIIQPAEQQSNAGGDGPCEDCGQSALNWFAPNTLWNLVKGGPDATDDPGGLLCPNCFIRRAETAGIVPTAWVVDREDLTAGRG